MTTASHDTLLGQTLGKFRVDKLIGQGGMGAVYEATDTSLDRKVALKVIKPDLASGTEGRDFLRRFEREAKAAARFKHPNAIEIHALDRTEDGLLYMALEYIKGRELIQVLRDQGPLQPPQAVHVLGQVLSALEAAHEAGIVHRDLKPHNIMIEDGPEMRAKILDFGIAKVRDSSEQAITMAGQVMGTAYYMAPEQAMGKEVDHRTDLYSVGVILYQVLTGKLPFKHKEFMKVLEMHVNSPPPTITTAGLEAFGPIVRRAMAKDPRDRFQSGIEFKNHLQAALRAGSTAPPTAPGSDPGSSPGGYPHSSSEHRMPTGASHSPVPGSPVPSSAAGSMADTSPMQGWQAGGTNQFFAALLGRTIGKYVVEEQLGEGGMGAVFRARDRLLGRPVALKVVHPSLAHRPDVRERFLREARATLEFSHPNAIATRGCDETPDGLLYMTLDYSPGETLRALLRREERLETPRALSVARQALLAIAEAHGKGIVHRDLKPENMLVERDSNGDDVVRVCDFGLAKLLDVSLDENGESLTQAGQSLGTPHYMAPEQVDGSAIDGRADIYSLGCVLYELLTGTKPFNADSIRSIVFMHMGATPEPLRQRAPHAKISPEVEAIVLKALEKEPVDRFPSAEAFLNAIDGLGLELPGARPSTSRHGRVTSSRQVSANDLTLPPTTRHSDGPPAAVMVLGALVALAIVGAVVVFGYRLSQQQRTPQVAANDGKTTVYEAVDAGKTGAGETPPTVVVQPVLKTAEKTDEPPPVKKTDEAPPPQKTDETKTPPVDPEAERKAEEEQARKDAEEERERKAAEAARKKREAAEDKRRKDAEAERRRKEREALEKKQRELDEAKQRAAAAKRKLEEERKKAAAATESERKAKDEAERKAKEAEAKRKAEAEKARKLQAELARIKAEQRKAAEEEREREAQLEARREQERRRRGYVRRDGLLQVERGGRVVLFERFKARPKKWISREVSLGAFLAYADQLPETGRARAETFLLRVHRMDPGVGEFHTRFPPERLKDPIQGVPLSLAKGFAKWFGCRLPSLVESRHLRDQWTNAKPWWAFSGEALAIRKGKFHAISQGVAALKPRLRLIGPPRLDD